jgi:hypothetical protein
MNKYFVIRRLSQGPNEFEYMKYYEDVLLFTKEHLALNALSKIADDNKEFVKGAEVIEEKVNDFNGYMIIDGEINIDN